MRWFGSASRARAALAAAAFLGLGIRAALAACQVTVAGGAPDFVPAGFRLAAAEAGHVRLTYAGHASFMVESPEGVGVFTDYNGVIRPKRLPDIVTMNRAHSTHFTDVIEPGIKHVLRGWDPAGGVAHHDVTERDMRVRNVPTNLRELGGGRQANENSIFIMEAAGVCVVHLSHVHHVLAPWQLQPIKDADVLLVPIDGTVTMSHDEAFDIIDNVKPRLIIPMHYVSYRAVDVFVARAQSVGYAVRRHDSDTIEVSLKSLPKSTEVLFLQGGHY
jgi:L-ascorbate metabolism protein UlaG (beta-lactamase superfamily)